MDEKTKETLKGIYENLTEEQKAKAKACKTMDEMMELAGEWGIELPDDMIDIVGGGLRYKESHVDLSDDEIKHKC